jgi:hypothetical protein
MAGYKGLVKGFVCADLCHKVLPAISAQEQVDDQALREAVRRAASGLLDADLGRGLVKQRIGRGGQGRSGGYRTVIAFRAGHRAVFLFGFAKNAQSNIDAADLAHWQAIGAALLAASNARINAAIAAKELTEVIQ